LVARTCNIPHCQNPFTIGPFVQNHLHMLCSNNVVEIILISME